MEKLFGVPIGQLMVTLLILFGIGLLIATVVALRNLVMFKMAVRNIPRRKSQTVLIVLGLMLATLLFSASFTTGDTLTHSLRVQAVENLGEVDEQVQAQTEEVAQTFSLLTPGATRAQYFDQGQHDRVQDSLKGNSNVEGVAPAIVEKAPALAPASKLSEPTVDVLGLDAGAMSSFEPLTDKQGKTLGIQSLGEGQAYVSTKTAEQLDLKTGDTVQVFLGQQPAAVKVAGVYADGAHPADEVSLVMPLAQLQKLTGKSGQINSILINNKGDEIQGGQYSDEVTSSLQSVLSGTGLEARPVKQDALDLADEQGSQFSTIFLLFGQFSVFAGILLIFLIFVMLAAERKRELGIARGVGMQRKHVVRMFAFEGAMYSLMSAAVGSLLGVLAGWGMVRIIAAALQQLDFEISFRFNWRSLVIAYTLGMVLTFIIVVISSWRVSRLNIVRAIRDIPEPSSNRKSLKGLILAIALPVLGVLLTMSGLSSQVLSMYMLGTSMLIIGIPLLARRFLRLPDRAAFTVAGVGLLVWWLLPNDVANAIAPGDEMKQGIEMFFLSGIMIVIAAVWVVVYNSDILLNGIVAVFGRIKGLPPVLKTAVSYPSQNRFRTGMTLAMFSLVVFTLVVMSFIIASLSGLYDDYDRLSGTYDVRAETSYTNPIGDIRAELKRSNGVTLSDFTAIGGLSGAPLQVKPENSQKAPGGLYVQGADAGYTDSVTYGMAMTAPGYDSAREVWQALQEQPNTAVISSILVPSKTNFNVGGPPPPIRLEGVYLEDKQLPENVYLTTRDPRTGKTARLRVIGVIEQTAFYAPQLVASQATVNEAVGQPLPIQTYVFRLRDGLNAEATAKKLESRFLENGLQATDLADEIDKSASANIMINNLLQGFMGLGLIVGIAALGVIAARSVVERRQQIGMLRAVGFQKSQVTLSFLLESSYVALLGIGIGVALGFALSRNIIDGMAEGFPGVTYQVPLMTLVLVVVVAYLASLLTTFLPARQASKVYPAEALRFE